jgi:hypothetical protein
MFRITVDYSDSINHYPSYKKIVTKFYFYRVLICTKTQTSDAQYFAKTANRR